MSLALIMKQESLSDCKQTDGTTLLDLVSSRNGCWVIFVQLTVNTSEQLGIWMWSPGGETDGDGQH